ncbi:alcohol oxidase [Periconia macrospinosa]|uniref:Alcohol oxidase n=1 Tax=Periconia macrospinosa TaxID=97972 RepID=A0A2V1DTV5_9PLEO|nr:alcohol oxidase [Periconia macrospinosa]
MVEQGPNNYGVPTIVHPALFLAGLAPTSNNTIFYQGVEEPQLANRGLVVPSGGTLGGGSSINLMMYSRAQRSDFDAWNVSGWAANDMIPYLKKLETYHGRGSNETHGFDGPINISGGTYRSNRSEDDWVQAAKKVGYPEFEDITSLDANNGFQRALRYIGPDGTRQDVASRYLHPKIQSGEYPNLHIVVNSLVKKVVFDNKRACGVEYESKSNSTIRTIRARKLVVVSSGALGTPSILERSGLGNPEVLKKAGVSEITADLPGVGENYQDHHLVIYPYYSSLSENETLDALGGGRVDVSQLIQEHAPILGWNAMDIACKIRPSDEEVAALGPAFQELWDEEYKNNLNKPLALGSLVSGFSGDPSLVPVGQYLSMSTFTAYPRSRGSIHITGPGSNDKPMFTTGFFSDPQNLDVKKHIWLYKKQREIFRRMELYRGELPIMHPPFSPESDARLIQTDAPLQNVKDIVYTAEDDRVIEEFVRKNVGTTWHSLGTCKMGPREEGGVVDANLSVYGVEGLKVADLSIPPENVAANTMNTAVAIGEKAADIFIKELGL